ncbi:MAG: hypothetical protein DMF01_03655 [Verrucomicrobia bacterium]|nr:MAG: hypothetical protein DMF01_03655 [Verrucomicrobiota bacterium]
MGTKLYVGNLPFSTTENELQELFSQAGAVQEVTLMQDRFTGKSRGFAFVTMGSDEDAQNAISKPPRSRPAQRSVRSPASISADAEENLGRAGFEPAKA